MAVIRVNDRLAIDETELDLAFARSGGPGGQHVNTSSTKVELRFDVAGSPSLSEQQRMTILTRLAGRITNDGVLVLTASEHRSQTRNREAVLGRFRALLAEALTPETPRRATRTPRTAIQRRREAKRRRADLKSLRRNPPVP